MNEEKPVALACAREPVCCLRHSVCTGYVLQIYGILNADLEYAQAVGPSAIPSAISSINGAPTTFGPALNGAYARYKLGSNTGPVPNSGNATVGIGTHPQAGGLGIRHSF